MYKRLLRKTLCLAITLTLLTGCQGLPTGNKLNTSSIFAMDTIMELSVSGDEALLSDAENMIRDLEKKVSVTDEASEISHLNNNGNAVVSTDTAAIIKGATIVADRTDGALDISIYPVLKSWGFTCGEYRVPSDEEIETLLENVDYSKIKIGETSKPEVSIPDGFQIDLGSVTKGYTSSKVAAFFREKGVNSALINLGGNVECIGAKPDGTKWKVAVKSPFQDSKSGIIGVIEASDMAIITSGGYERFFEQDGHIYWHILDPSTGKPADTGLLSVTIAGKDGLMCDGLSTALFVCGLEKSIDIWKQYGDFDAIFVTTEGEVYVTEGIADSFTLSSEYYNAPLHILSH